MCECVSVSVCLEGRVKVCDSQSIPGSCRIAGTMTLGVVSSRYIVLVGSVNTCNKWKL